MSESMEVTETHVPREEVPQPESETNKAQDQEKEQNPDQFQKMLVEHYVVADRPCPPEQVLDKSYGIHWFNVTGLNLSEIETRIALILENKHPVHVVCLAYQAQLQENVADDVFLSIQRMQVKAGESKIHRFSAASCIFIPDYHRDWDTFAQFNKKLRQLAIDTNTQPLLIHKPLLERQREQAVLCVNPTYFLEYLAGSSLGLTITRDGLKKIMVPIVKHLTIGMFCKDPLKYKSDPAALSPTPPGLTNKYLRSPSMVEHLRNRGLYVAVQNKRGARSLSNPRKKNKRIVAPVPSPEPSTACRREVTKIRWSTRTGSVSSGYNSGPSRSSRSSRRSTSEADVAAVAADRRESDLEDTVFANAATEHDAIQQVCHIRDKEERYRQMMTAYGAAVTENYALKTDVKQLNKEITELERFKRKTLDGKDRKLEKELELMKYHDKLSDRSIQRLNKKLRDAGREYGELSEDLREWRDTCQDLRKERDEVLDSRKELQEMYDQLLDENKALRDDKKERRKRK